MGKSGSTGNFIARLLKLMLDRQHRRPVGMVMSILDGQIPCWTSKIYAKLLSSSRSNMDKYTQKCFQQISVSKFHPEICRLNLLVIKRDGNCVGERRIIPLKKWNTEGSSNSHSSNSVSTWRMVSSAWFPCTKRLIQLTNKLSWFTC